MIASGSDRAYAAGARNGGHGGRALAERIVASGAQADAGPVAQPANGQHPALAVVNGSVNSGSVNGAVHPGRIHEGFLARLGLAILQPGPEDRLALVAEMRAAGIPWEDLADLYIPEAARRLGALWCEDELGFADVTIGTARLQAMLRDTLPDPEARHPPSACGPSVLVAVRRDDYHTLGAMVTAARLRRAGVSVRLSLGQPDADIIRLLARGAHDALFLSASCSRTLDSLRELVEKVRQSVGRAVPVVIGGTILLSEGDVRARTGADLAMSDPLEALRLCGLRVPRQAWSAVEIGR